MGPPARSMTSDGVRGRRSVRRGAASPSRSAEHLVQARGREHALAPLLDLLQRGLLDARDGSRRQLAEPETELLEEQPALASALDHLHDLVRLPLDLRDVHRLL